MCMYTLWAHWNILDFYIGFNNNESNFYVLVFNAGNKKIKIILMNLYTVINKLKILIWIT